MNAHLRVVVLNVFVNSLVLEYFLGVFAKGMFFVEKLFHFLLAKVDGKYAPLAFVVLLLNFS